MKILRFTKVWLRNYRVWRKNIMATLVGNLGQPFLFLIAMGYGMGRDIESINGLSYLQFIAPGLVASSVMYSAAFETTYGSYTRLSLQKTYEAILMTPLTITDLVLGEIAWGASKGLFSALIMVAALPLFGVWPSPWAIGLIPLLLVSGIFFAALGLIMTALATNYEFFNYFISLIITPLFLFSGIFFPLDSLAPPVQSAFLLLPLPPVVDLSRMLTYGRFEGPLLLKILIPLLSSLITVWLAKVLIERRLIK
ncbi:MAG: ABC transporter permease [Desulfobulbaceae bacterium]|nr:ABC transporter permease [Desulfobulbaceae bacterium]HIJ78925.1 ABC transporter permease [Deltaproteobacteria bacterium]